MSADTTSELDELRKERDRWKEDSHSQTRAIQRLVEAAHDRDEVDVARQKFFDEQKAELLTRLETAESACAENCKRISSLEAKIHAAHGLIAPLGNQVTPSVLAIREAIQILKI